MTSLLPTKTVNKTTSVINGLSARFVNILSRLESIWIFCGLASTT